MRALAVLLLTAAPALAAPGDRPTDLIAADLGIPEQAFIDCFANVRPDPDHTPSGARQHANKAVLLPYLQAANPAITNASLDTVMDRYRPEGPMRKQVRPGG
ncbi:hypothetical protein [Pseudoruegeria sp. HB172150]|uniref:hypothetical protein n=1 Tax=Pseudoruegeria sp. HB172150 TaxID=2721164 RepID=UPI0015522E28|nr:hypothetical protein [Pseudoruegeria sp. HB172150]